MGNYFERLHFINNEKEEYFYFISDSTLTSCEKYDTSTLPKFFYLTSNSNEYFNFQKGIILDFNDTPVLNSALYNTNNNLFQITKDYIRYGQGKILFSKEKTYTIIDLDGTSSQQLIDNKSCCFENLEINIPQGVLVISDSTNLGNLEVQEIFIKELGKENKRIDYLRANEVSITKVML